MAQAAKRVTLPELRKSEDVKPVKKTPIHYPFWFGGSASCLATFFTHPLDLGKSLRSSFVQHVGFLADNWNSKGITYGVACACCILTILGPTTNTGDSWRTIKYDANVFSCHED